MPKYDLIDTQIIESTPDKVWAELVSELNGGGKWWTPKNTFKAGARPPQELLGETEVTVHAKGVDQGGPKFKFIARTTSVDPGKRIAADYVSGSFLGSCEFFVEPAAGDRTKLSMHFNAAPQGFMKFISKLSDVGQQHSEGAQGAFTRLNALLSGKAPTTNTIDSTVRTSDGAEIAVTVATPAGPALGTVVLSHGWAAGREAWAGVQRRLLGAGHTVVSYDQRGHGASTLGSAPITVERLGKDLADVLAAVNVRDAVLAGHSGGGFAAQWYVTAKAAEAEVRVKALALFATAAHDQDAPDSEIKLMGNPVFSFALRRAPIGRAMLGSTLGPEPLPSVSETNRRMFAAIDRKTRAAFFAAGRGMDFRAALATVTVPTVVLAGDADTVIKPELGAAVADALPNSRFESVPRCGHMLPLEAPERLAQVILELAG